MSDLLQRLKRVVDPRLLPVIVLMVAGLVAVPMLVRDSENAQGATAAVPAPAAEEPAQPDAVVSLDAPEPRGKQRLGARHNPFKADPPEPDDDGGGAKATPTPAAAAGGGGGGGADADADPKEDDKPSEATATPTPTPTATPTPTPTPAAEESERIWQASLRYVQPGEEPEGGLLRRLAGIPNLRRPTLLFMGLRRDHKTAVFLVAAGVGVQGDGDCWPAPGDCKQLALRAGDSALLSTSAGTTAVVLGRVRQKTVSVAAAQKARGVVAPGGRMALRTMLDRVASLRYDRSTGFISTLDGRSRATP